VNRCRDVSTKSQAELTQTLADRPSSWAGGWPLGPLGLGFGPLGPRVKYTPVVMLILAFGQLHFVIH
jgi:hypothetical protein